MKTILGCYSAKVLTNEEASVLKQYTFNAPDSTKVGDRINHDSYTTPIQVTKVLDGEPKKFVHLKTGELTNEPSSPHHFKIKEL